MLENSKTITKLCPHYHLLVLFLVKVTLLGKCVSKQTILGEQESVSWIILDASLQTKNHYEDSSNVSPVHCSLTGTSELPEIPLVSKSEKLHFWFRIFLAPLHMRSFSYYIHYIYLQSESKVVQLLELCATK